MNAKVSLSKEIAGAIEYYRAKGYSNLSIVSEVINNKTQAKCMTKFVINDINNFDKIMSALVNGYEVEKSPEDKVRDLYEDVRNRYPNFTKYDEGYLASMTDTLCLLGIKIEGVNVHEQR
jgi:hypothetical protein